jgi:GNAT superfamily N-acetyltransferase
MMPGGAAENVARLYGWGLALTVSFGQGGEILWTPVGVATLSGSDAPGLNSSLVWSAASPADYERLVAFIHGRGRTGNHVMVQDAVEALAPHALRHGLVPAGRMPLLVLTPQRPPPMPDWDGEVERVQRWETVRDEATPLVAEAFDLPLEAMRALVGPLTAADCGLDVFVARRDGVAVSTVYTTRQGGAVGIWNLATPPRWQRQGAGRAVLAAAIAHHMASGARLFYLSATRAGISLYIRLGFMPATTLVAWSLPLQKT